MSRNPSKRLIAFSATVEIITGLALIIGPEIVIPLLMGQLEADTEQPPARVPWHGLAGAWRSLLAMKEMQRG